MHASGPLRLDAPSAQNIDASFVFRESAEEALPGATYFHSAQRVSCLVVKACSPGIVAVIL
jgi:hypothetical protein